MNQRELERFMGHIQVEGECWIWKSALTHNGYGQFTLAGNKTAIAHRVSYEHFVGPIPKGKQLDHVVALGCISRACVNPSHLEPVTAKINIQRGKTGTNPRSQDHNRKKIRCVHGHRLSGRNLHVDRNGHRRCRACGRANTQRSRLQLKGR